jgi:hypothetical protein
MSKHDQYLQDDAEGQYTARLTRLLRDEHHDNSALVLELITGGGSNRRVLGYLFGLSVFHADKAVSRKALDLLRKHSDDNTVQQALRLREGAAYYYNEADFFEKYAGASFDLFDFVLAAKMCHWHRNSSGHSQYFILSHQTLNLTHFNGTVLPPSVANLDFIRYLTLPSGRDFDLEASFPHLAELPLENVYMENRRLDQFPTVLFRLPCLRTLSIKRGTHRPRQPMEVPEGGPWGCATLEKLIVDSFPLTGEARLGPFPALLEATLPKCALGSLDFLEHSPALEVLDVRQNYLEEIPAFLGGCTALRTLQLSDNPLRKIHLDLERLTVLESLEIKCQFKTV